MSQSNTWFGTTNDKSKLNIIFNYAKACLATPCFATLITMYADRILLRHTLLRIDSLFVTTCLTL